METIEQIKHVILSGGKFFKGIKLPKGQTGTYMQQSSYAYLKAREIFTEHFQNKNSQEKTSAEKVRIDAEHFCNSIA